MDWTVVASRVSPHQCAFQELMARGLEAHGQRVTRAHPAQGVATKRVACWGWRIGKGLRDLGHSVLVMERGYIGDRFAWTSLAWNGLNNRGAVPAVPRDGGARFEQHFPGALQPMRDGGDYVLLVGQVPGDMSLQGRDLAPWYAEQAARMWGLPVRFRPHPLAHKRGRVAHVPKAPHLAGSLQDALAGAALVVTFNSNTAVDALVAGRSVEVHDEGSMAWNVTDRESWAHRLAWRQWSPAEIESGAALEYVGLTDAS